MKREIKFRAYIRDEGRLLDVSLIDFNDEYVRVWDECGKNVTQDINEFLDNSNISYIDLCPLSGSPRYGAKVILVYEERILVDK